jgi:hypothetical protein
MPTPNNIQLYESVKQMSNKIYSKPSAYRSGYIVKTYKSLGGTYSNDGEEKSLDRWFREKWADIGNKQYPVYRPTIRINRKTPLTVSEIDSINLKNQIKLKQKIKGKSNLPNFKQK